MKLLGILWTITLATGFTAAQNWTHVPANGMEYQLIAWSDGSNHPTLQDYCTPSSNFRPRTADVAGKVINKFKDQFNYSCRIWLGIFRNGTVWKDRFENLVAPGMWKQGQPQRISQRAYIFINNKNDTNIQWTSTLAFIPIPRDYFICQRDHNECASGIDVCPEEGFRCENLFGSYHCVCKSGYSSSGDQCLDIDECKGNHTCAQNCTNTQGSFVCSCFSAFKPSDDGTGICVCKPGYSLSGDQCLDIDECARTISNECEQDCINTRGSFRCICQEGLQLAADGKTCEDIDECKGNHTCAQNCTNTQGSFVCSCLSGFKPSDDGTGNCIKGQNLDLCLANDTRFHCPCLLGMRITKDQSTGEILCKEGCIGMTTHLHYIASIGIGIVLVSMLFDSWSALMRNAEKYRKRGSKSSYVSPIRLADKKAATTATTTSSSDESKTTATTATTATTTFTWTNALGPNKKSDKSDTNSLISSITTYISSMFSSSVGSKSKSSKSFVSTAS